MTKKRTVNLRLSVVVFDKVKSLADADERSFNYMVEKILKAAITEKKDKP